jgi:hypothetical protein
MQQSLLNRFEKRADGRKAPLVYPDEDTIKRLKKLAVDDDCNVYDLVEEATQEWLRKQELGTRDERT